MFLFFVYLDTMNTHLNFSGGNVSNKTAVIYACNLLVYVTVIDCNTIQVVVTKL
jgi:hypothetical protein